MNTTTNPAPTVDLRTIAPHERHSLVFTTFMALPPGAAMELINDHNPPRGKTARSNGVSRSPNPPAASPCTEWTPAADPAAADREPLP